MDRSSELLTVLVYDQLGEKDFLLDHLHLLLLFEYVDMFF
jgi:hypothetical protein